MGASAVTRLHQLELFGLYALVFSLPIMESPKHFAIVLFSVGALGWRLLQKPIGWRKPDTFEWLLFSMWLVSLASTLANWPMEPGIRGFENLSCILFLFWALYRNTYKESQIRLFLWILIAAVMLGLVEGLWEWKSGIRGHLEFHSAGVVTQSAIYLGISMFLMFGIFLDTASGFNIYSVFTVLLNSYGKSWQCTCCYCYNGVVKSDIVPQQKTSSCFGNYSIDNNNHDNQCLYRN